jgi:hypothetical protein
MRVVPIKARYASRGRMLGVVPTERPSWGRGTMEVWSADAAGKPKPSDRSAEHGIAADRFAREIVAILT